MQRSSKPCSTGPVATTNGTARAERLNGILKQEYGLGAGFACKPDAYQAVAQAVLLYNHHRPHQSLSYA
ncbi:MAG: integrase core domain-containing protein, partial [Phycisphaerae bacterium]|nr:integrase core domain-containing protein [Phycisphaerae bacterium]